MTCPNLESVRMQPLHAALIVGSIVFLFFLWNFKTIFGSGKTGGKQAKSVKSFGSEEEDVTALVISEVLALNRAAHTLTRSGRLLDKLLKMEPREACDHLIRDYGLSSVMVLVRKEGHEHVIEEGFKKVSDGSVSSGNSDGSSSDIAKSTSSSKINSDTSDKKSTSDSKNTLNTLNTLNTQNTLKNTLSTPVNTQVDHSVKDPVDPHPSLRIALLCKNIFRPPMIGKVVKMVESEADHDEKYIVELVK